MNDSIRSVVTTSIGEIIVFNPVIARKLTLALSQLDEAKSIEQYQQIGIVIRDALIEFSQSIFSREMVPATESLPGSNDAKKMIKYTLDFFGINGKLNDIVKVCLDYSNTIQHDTNIKHENVIEALSITSLCVCLIIEAIQSQEKYKSRPYYKCPNCGSLKLSTTDHWEIDIDAGWRMDKLVCEHCGWYYIEDMGGMSGVE